MMLERLVRYLLVNYCYSGLSVIIAYHPSQISSLSDVSRSTPISQQETAFSKSCTIIDKKTKKQENVHEGLLEELSLG